MVANLERGIIFLDCELRNQLVAYLNKANGYKYCNCWHEYSTKSYYGNVKRRKKCTKPPISVLE
jgi:hypothetical protein